MLAIGGKCPHVVENIQKEQKATGRSPWVSILAFHVIPIVNQESSVSDYIVALTNYQTCLAGDETQCVNP